MKKNQSVEKLEEPKIHIKEAIKENTVIQCETEQEANRILGMAHELGYRWWIGKGYEDNTEWDIYKSKMCYDLFGGSYSHYDYFNNKNYTIIPSTQIADLEEAKSSVEVQHSPLAKSFEHIANGSRHVLNLLEDLLTWAMAQRGEVRFHPEAINIGELIDETIAALMPMVQLKEIEIIFEQKNLMAYGDKNMVKTIYRNLLSNAIKFTPNRGAITTGLEMEGGMVIVSVKDTGMGMSRDLLDKILVLGNGDLKRTGTGGEKGTGLGLMVCKEFVERNQGTLGVESEEGKGSIFYFSLPASNKNE